MLFFSFELYAQKVDLITKKEAIKDVKYLKKYLMNSYVIYDENSQLNDKLEEIDTRIINELELLEKDEIYVQDFQQLIVKDLKKNVSIPDSHLVVFSTENFSKIFPHNDIYFPGITLEKQNENFIVFENYSDEIKKGDVYTGKKDNIFPTLCTDGSLKFQYGVKSSKPIKLCSFPHDNTNSNVLLKSKKTEANLSLDNRNENIKILDDKIYLSNLDFTNSKKYVEKFPIDSKEIPNYSLILDLRNNSGGNTNGVLDFIHLFLFANDESVNKEQLKNYFSEGEKVLISADIWDANLDLSRSLGVPRSTLLKMSLIKWLYKIFKIKHVSIE